MSKFKIICQPISDNGVTEKKKNKGGIVVYLSDASLGGRHEVARVAYERKNSAHPDVDFETQLREVVGTARAAVKVIEEQLTGDGELQ